MLGSDTTETTGRLEVVRETTEWVFICAACHGIIPPGSHVFAFVYRPEDPGKPTFVWRRECMGHLIAAIHAAEGD